MHFIGILGHKHTSTQTPPQTKPANAFSVIPLGIFTIVSTMPHNALTFESNLSHSPTQQITSSAIAQTQEPAAAPVITASPTVSVLALNNPVTVTAPRRQTPVPIVITPATPRPIPQTGNPLVLQGEASFYSRAGCLGCSPALRMANGQPLNDNALTMAIGADKKHLVGRQAKVTNLVTGKSVNVTITDTGGFYQAKYGHRVADLTIATKQAIGMNGGVGQVRVEVY